MQLRELQQQFAQEVLFSTVTDLRETIQPHGIEPHRRLQIYKNNIDSTLAESLQNVFPVTCAIVGEEFFKFAARKYLAENPPASGNLHDYGKRFPEFIGVMKELAELAYVVDVARMDWACHAAFHSVATASVPLNVLTRFASEDHERLVLVLHPSVTAISSSFPIFDIWNFAGQRSGEGEVPDIYSGGQSVVILRNDDETKVIHIDDGLNFFINQIEQQNTLGVIIPSLLEAKPDYNLQSGLHRIFEIGAIAEVTVIR